MGERRVRAYVGLGSNVGDAPATLAWAVDALSGLPGVRVRAVSPLYVTAPWGVTDQPDFHNAVVAVDVPAGRGPGAGRARAPRPAQDVGAPRWASPGSTLGAARARSRPAGVRAAPDRRRAAARGSVQRCRARPGQGRPAARGPASRRRGAAVRPGAPRRPRAAARAARLARDRRDAPANGGARRRRPMPCARSQPGIQPTAAGPDGRGSRAARALQSSGPMGRRRRDRARGRRTTMTTIGYAAMLEQFHPTEPAGLVRPGRGRRLRGRLHGQRALPPMDAAAGPERVRVGLPGRARAAHEPQVRDRGHLPRLPLPPGGDRPRGGDDRGDVPGPLLSRPRRG